MMNKWGNVRKAICLLMAVLLLWQSSGVLDLQAQSKVHAAEWDGVAREKTWELERCRIVYSLTDHWADGYSTTITLENTSDESIENWHVSFPAEQEIVDMWNAQLIETAEDTKVFKNVEWNQDIAVGQSITFGFTAKGSFTGFPEICQLPACRQTVPETDYEITYQVINTWETGHTGEVCIRNVSERTIEDWYVSFDCNHEISDLWNGVVVSWENGRYLIKNSDYNQNIKPGEEICFGFTVNASAEEEPGVFVVEEITLGEMADTTGTADGGDIVDCTELKLVINTEAFDYNEAADMYLTQQRVETLTGTLSDAEQVEKLSFSIIDINDTVVGSGEVEIGESWETPAIGLVLGLNCITFRAVYEQDKELVTTIYLMNFNKENMADADVDLSDSDGDGINNYTESILGTDAMSDDTDGDGLKDLDEMRYTGTSPLMEDTDENGVKDGQEDSDEDGLCHVEELRIGSEALYEDTDGDGLTDGEEVLEYLTDPLVADKDEDGLSDGEDVELGFDPLNPDTDGDGILDGDEISYQTCVKEMEQEKVAGVTQVAVSMDCAGYIDNEVHIMNVYDLDMRSTDVVGRFGAPVSIESTQEFDEATITFTYDESALGETSEDNLRIMWYDEENDKYNLLDEETVLDKENNTVSCKTEHFSTWLLVDVEAWLAAMSSSLIYQNIQPRLKWTYDKVYILHNMDYRGYRYVRPYLILYNRQEIIEDANGLYSSTSYLKNVGTADSEKAAFEISINFLKEEKQSNIYKEIYFISLKDIEYDSKIVQSAKKNNITINYTDVKKTDFPNVSKMVSETGGICIVKEKWNYDEFHNSLMASKVQGRYEDEPELLYIDLDDDDKDGLGNYFEERGMLLSNGTTEYRNPKLSDTDGDGITDLQEIGCTFPKKVNYTVGGKDYSFFVFQGSLYEKLPSDFIFVDGTVNADGTVNNEKMGYVSHSNQFENEKYVNRFYPNVFDETQSADGDAGVHGIYSYLLAEQNAKITALKYSSFNTLLVTAISVLAQDPYAVNSFYTYVMGTGGKYEGCRLGGTRDYFPVKYMLYRNNNGRNSARNCFEENMHSVQAAVETILNEHNQETYIALSPNIEQVWSGCNYVDYSNLVTGDVLDIASNVSAFGIFNSAEASVTLHCTYEPTTQTYEAEYIYYIVDFYDYTFLKMLYEEDALGLARSYELFGMCEGTTQWTKGETADWLWGE